MYIQYQATTNKNSNSRLELDCDSTTYKVASSIQQFTCPLIFRSFWMYAALPCLQLPRYRNPGKISIG